MNAGAKQMDAIRSPYDGSVVGEMPLAGEAEIEAAIVAAQRGFAIMRRLPRFVRGDILQRASEILKGRREEAARLISAEAGKPLFAARGEVSRAIFNLANAAAEARRTAGEEIPLDMDAGIFEYQTTGAQGARIDLSNIEQLQAGSRRIGIARRFPIGPILAIAPFNFPLNLVLHKVAPALASGSVVRPDGRTAVAPEVRVTEPPGLILGAAYLTAATAPQKRASNTSRAASREMAASGP